MICFLGELHRLRLEQQAQWSYCSDPPREGYFRLYNKNGERTTFVRPIEQSANRYGWIVEANEPLDPYFDNILKREPS